MAQYLTKNILYIKNNPILEEIETYLDDMVSEFANVRTNYADKLVNAENIKLDLILQLAPKKSVFIFHSSYLFYYQFDNKLYVDIDHIISALVKSANLDDDNYYKLFRNFSYKICFSCWVKSNGTCGYKKRDLIDIITAAKMITSVDCDFSKMFLLQCVLYMIFIRFMYAILIALYLRQFPDFIDFDEMNYDLD